MSWNVITFWIRRIWRYQRAIRIRKSKKGRQHNCQKYKRKKQRSTKLTHKTKDQVKRAPLKTGNELRCSGIPFLFFFPNDIILNKVLTTTPFRIHHLHYTSPINTLYIKPIQIKHLRYISPKTPCTLTFHHTPFMLHLSQNTMYMTPFSMHHVFNTIPKLPFMLYNFLYTIYATLFIQHHLHYTLFHTLLTLHCSQNTIYIPRHILPKTSFMLRHVLCTTSDLSIKRVTERWHIWKRRL
jgi:hypothetical protein